MYVGKKWQFSNIESFLLCIRIEYISNCIKRVIFVILCVTFHKTNELKWVVHTFVSWLNPKLANNVCQWWTMTNSDVIFKLGLPLLSVLMRYLDRYLDHDQEDAPVYTRHSLFNLTNILTFLFIVQSLFNCNPTNIWMKIFQIECLHWTRTYFTRNENYLDRGMIAIFILYLSLYHAQKHCII